jgi:RNA polymerase sigma factor (sigma-70 family)
VKTEPLNALLEKLCRGDAGAAEQVFVHFEPYLRMVVRRHLSTRLRTKFDSIDVVQSIWSDVLTGFRSAGWRFADADHLKAFLVKVTRNRLIDQTRHHRCSVERDQPLGITEPEQMPSRHQPRPSEVAQADDLWQQMLVLCPPAHHELLRLKREGLSLDEIAVRTGLHKSSVRRILYELARRLNAEDSVTPFPLPAAGENAE